MAPKDAGARETPAYPAVEAAHRRYHQNYGDVDPRMTRRTASLPPAREAYPAADQTNRWFHLGRGTVDPADLPPRFPEEESPETNPVNVRVASVPPGTSGATTSSGDAKTQKEKEDKKKKDRERTGNAGDYPGVDEDRRFFHQTYGDVTRGTTLGGRTGMVGMKKAVPERPPLDRLDPDRAAAARPASAPPE